METQSCEGCGETVELDLAYDCTATVGDQVCNVYPGDPWWTWDCPVCGRHTEFAPTL